MIECEPVRMITTKDSCDQEGCVEIIGFPCYLPDAGNDPSGYYCTSHAFDNGFCKMCGEFWGGIESFEFLQNGYCDECYQELGRNDDESGDDDPADDY